MSLVFFLFLASEEIYFLEVPILERKDIMVNGTVKWFNTNKGYGFIEPDDGGKDVFIHISAVEKSGLKTLLENQKITFEINQDKGRSSAANIKIVS